MPRRVNNPIAHPEGCLFSSLLVIYDRHDRQRGFIFIPNRRPWQCEHREQLHMFAPLELALRPSRCLLLAYSLLSLGWSLSKCDFLCGAGPPHTTATENATHYWQSTSTSCQELTTHSEMTFRRCGIM